MNWRVPFFEIDIGDDEIKAVTEVMKAGWISMGSITRKLESEFAKKLGVKHAVAVSNCTATLHLALLCCDIKENDEVIVPSLTFVATVNA